MASHQRKKALSLPSVAQEVAHRCSRDRITPEAASIAFYFFLSFFPLILSLFALTGLIGREAAFDWIMEIELKENQIDWTLFQDIKLKMWTFYFSNDRRNKFF